MNRLKFETSPYLLQHANNPVDWFAWKPEAFERAQKEDKLIILSIGYSTCHWCHVMEKESFEDDEVAKIMNENFICIKVDREERPDVDQIYMEACQAMTGSGGWPLNCFLLPDGRPFFAGTYYPPQPAYNRPSWTQVLFNVINAYTQKRDVVEDQANHLTKIIQEADRAFLTDTIEVENFEAARFSFEAFAPIFKKIKNSFDTKNGGFGGAPKFPGTMTHELLLNYYFFTGDQEAFRHVQNSVHKMIQGGIYDQIGGGFSRYSTDNEWLVPHFEKMLYDNALLVGLLSDLIKIKPDSIILEALTETIDFVKREMSSEEGGFFSALDADSEGIEGKFYVWAYDEFIETLGEDYELIAKYYGVKREGNWEQTNILFRPLEVEKFLQTNGIEKGYWEKTLKSAKQKLLQSRSKRVRPSLDDKVILGWNALMSTAFLKAYSATQVNEYKEIAKNNIDFLLEKFKKEGTESLALMHTYKDGLRQYDAFLDDYAFLIQALLELYQVNFDLVYLDLAYQYCQFTIKNFLDKETNLFYFTQESQRDIIIRKKEYYDSAIPSGNSTMAWNLFQLAKFFNNKDFEKLGVNMILSFKESINKYPSSFARWVKLWLQLSQQHYEVAIVGKDYLDRSNRINGKYWPNKIVMANEDQNDKFPILAGRKGSKTTKIYICQNYSCQLPVETVEEATKIVLPNWISDRT